MKLHFFKKKKNPPEALKLLMDPLRCQNCTLNVIVFFSIYLSVCMALLGFVVFTTLTLHTDSLRGVY